MISFNMFGIASGARNLAKSAEAKGDGSPGESPPNNPSTASSSRKKS
jgi:hypothetical protein